MLNKDLTCLIPAVFLEYAKIKQVRERLCWQGADFVTSACVFLGDLADAIRSHTNITFGLYHSLFEWFNPLYLKDSANNFSTQDYVKVHAVIEYRFQFKAVAR